MLLPEENDWTFAWEIEFEVEGETLVVEFEVVRDWILVEVEFDVFVPDDTDWTIAFEVGLEAAREVWILLKRDGEETGMEGSGFW